MAWDAAVSGTCDEVWNAAALGIVRGPGRKHFIYIYIYTYYIYISVMKFLIKNVDSTTKLINFGPFDLRRTLREILTWRIDFCA